MAKTILHTTTKLLVIEYQEAQHTCTYLPNIRGHHHLQLGDITLYIQMLSLSGPTHLLKNRPDIKGVDK